MKWLVFSFVHKVLNFNFKNIHVSMRLHMYVCVLFVYLFSPICWGYRLEMTSGPDTEDSEVLSPRKNLEEEYLTYEAKVITGLFI